MYKSIVLIGYLFLQVAGLNAQNGYDYITISRFVPGEDPYSANWNDSLKSGSFSKYVFSEKKIVSSPQDKSAGSRELISLVAGIKSNGTEDVSKCFIPRHSVNFYRGGKIVRYLLVCFECDGVRFSDDPAKPFIRSVSAREKQMGKLKEVFEGMW